MLHGSDSVGGVEYLVFDHEEGPLFAKGFAVGTTAIEILCGLCILRYMDHYSGHWIQCDFPLLHSTTDRAHSSETNNLCSHLAGLDPTAAEFDESEMVV